MKKKKRKMTKKQIIKHVKSISIKCLFILATIFVLIGGYLGEFTKYNKWGYFFGFGYFLFIVVLFLVFVCDFDIIEKVKIKECIRYKYKIKNIDKFLKTFLGNIKNDGGDFVIRMVINENEYYFYNKFDQKIIDSSIYQWYTIVILNNNECNYLSDLFKCVEKVYTDYYKKNKIKSYRMQHWFSYIIIMPSENSEENKKLLKKIEVSGYTFRIKNPIILCGISLESNILYIPSLNASGRGGNWPYAIMKRKIIKFLKSGKKEIKKIEKDKNK